MVCTEFYQRGYLQGVQLCSVVKSHSQRLQSMSHHRHLQEARRKTQQQAQKQMKSRWLTICQTLCRSFQTIQALTTQNQQESTYKAWTGKSKTQASKGTLISASCCLKSSWPSRLRRLRWNPPPWLPRAQTRRSSFNENCCKQESDMSKRLKYNQQAENLNWQCDDTSQQIHPEELYQRQRD